VAGLPAPPARVLEIGCGPLGGFVPMLRASGYDATGVDPRAPELATARPSSSEADEQAAIDAGQIRANRIHYRGKRA
jgi:2-polyprenyl-3-methyl-5-hydroxy-6-metoxy-1,4-benzoquinol methylase